jgi:hypothetical protein
MGVECEGVLKRWITKTSNATVTGCCIEMVAGPVEDALVGLEDLLVFGEDAQGRSVDGDKEIILENVSMCVVQSCVIHHLSTCDQFIPIWCPRQREWALADLDFAHTSLGPNVPKSNHTV